MVETGTHLLRKLPRQANRQILSLALDHCQSSFVLSGAPIDRIDDWAIRFRAAIAAPDGLPALTAIEAEAFAKGRQFRDVFSRLKRLYLMCDAAVSHHNAQHMPRRERRPRAA